jgi:eukaryotic-like serine/threonine-protein kinase
MDALRDAVQASLASAYTLERELGGGGMSRVFLARDNLLDRPVVVKALLPELASGVSVQRFALEVRAAVRVQHPHIVPVLFAGHTAGEIPFYIMPFVQGETLAQRLARARVRFVEAAAILGDVAKALGAAHEAGLVHRDVKPDNILLCGGAAVVTDFGIAQAMEGARVGIDPRLTTAHTSLGTPAYLAPEQAVGELVDARADVYSWGVVGYEMIAGHHPFPLATTAQKLLAAHIAERPRPLSSVAMETPPWLCALLMRCLEKEPALRPANGSALVRAMEAGETGRRSFVERYAVGVRRLFGGSF